MKKIKPTKIIFLAMFFFSIHLAMTAYINSSFAGSFGLSNMDISLVYIVSALVTILGLFTIPKITMKIGNRKTLIALLSLIIITLLFFIFSKSTILIVILLALYLGMHSLVFFELDVLLEHFSDESLTGRIRGALLTILSIAWTISPFLAGYILEQFGFQSIYIIGLAATVVVLVIMIMNFKKRGVARAHVQTPKEAFRILTHNVDLFGVFTLSTLLSFFYAVMIIFSPLYLHNLGFSWIEIGLLFTIMHAPFLILEYPLGRLADRKIGEKEIMIIGLVITALGCFAFLLTTKSDFITWSAILILSRIGASFLETGSETYFFKKVDHDDIEIISAYRNASPIAIILGSLTGFAVSLAGMNIHIVFVIMGILLLLGIFPALRIKDTL